MIMHNTLVLSSFQPWRDTRTDHLNILSFNFSSQGPFFFMPLALREHMMKKEMKKGRRIPAGTETSVIAAIEIYG